MTTRLADRWPVYVTVLLFLIITAVFVLEFIASSQGEAEQPESNITYNTEQIMQLVDQGTAQRGAALVEEYGCIVCHRLGAANQNIAPPFVGVAERAAAREQGLTAVEYLYISITNPAAFVVEGYNPVMPQNYPERLTEAELGDIIAYLLTPDAN
jgi:cytochrome c551/c552